MSVTEESTDTALNRVDDPDFYFRGRAKPLRLFFRVLEPLVDEVVVSAGKRKTAEWDDNTELDGLHAFVKDPANIALAAVTLPAEGGGFTEWGSVPDSKPYFRWGVNVDNTLDHLKYARMAGQGVGDDGDPVLTKYDDDLRRLELTATRPNQSTQKVTALNLIDPDSVREEPDIPPMTLKNVGHPENTRALKDAVETLDNTSDMVRVRADPENDEAFQFYAKGDVVRSDTVRFMNGYEIQDAGGEPDSDIRGQSSLFSMDYLEQIVRGLHRAKMDKVTIRWGDEFPAVFQFFNEDYGIRGCYMVAPRINEND